MWNAFELAAAARLFVVSVNLERVLLNIFTGVCCPADCLKVLQLQCVMLTACCLEVISSSAVR